MTQDQERVTEDTDAPHGWQVERNTGALWERIALRDTYAQAQKVVDTERKHAVPTWKFRVTPVLSVPTSPTTSPSIEPKAHEGTREIWAIELEGDSIGTPLVQWRSSQPLLNAQAHAIALRMLQVLGVEHHTWRLMRSVISERIRVVESGVE